MQITILTVGSHGDVQPYVALGAGLREAGYDVTLVTSARFAEFVTAAGLQHAPIRADFLQLVETPEGKAALAGGNPLRLMQRVMPMLRQLLDDCWEAARQSDALIYHPKALGGYHIAERLGVPGILAHPVPLFSPTRAFPSPVLPVANLGGTLNRLSHRLVLRLTTAPYRKLITAWRRDVLGLPQAQDELVHDGHPAPRLYGYSSHVLPLPPDWDASNVVTGYWFLDQRDNWQPPAVLEGFLAHGSAPVYVGFGSMAAQDARQKGAIVVEALAQAGLRGVIGTGTGGLTLDTVPEHICVIESAPHDWLFPRVAAVVHHGGAGTTAAGLRAGKPTIICPFFGDQPFWGRRMAALGVGPQPIPQRRLSVSALTQALQVATRDVAMQQRAVELGARIRSEDGVGQAVAWISTHLASHSPLVRCEAPSSVETNGC
jgi:sterol 3beta-glucosyltransferase